jgi:hypothetical protein
VPRSSWVKGGENMKQKSMVDGLGLTEERAAQIAEMAVQTFKTSEDVAMESAKVSGIDGYDRVFETISKTQQEDIKLLTSIEEGVIYGYAIGQLVSDYYYYSNRGGFDGAITVIDMNTMMQDLLKAIKKGDKAK